MEYRCAVACIAAGGWSEVETAASQELHVLVVWTAGSLA